MRNPEDDLIDEILYDVQDKPTPLPPKPNVSKETKSRLKPDLSKETKKSIKIVLLLIITFIIVSNEYFVKLLPRNFVNTGIPAPNNYGTLAQLVIIVIIYIIFDVLHNYGIV